MLLNSGLVRPVLAILPEGTVLNATNPAAVGMRSAHERPAHALGGCGARVCKNPERRCTVDSHAATSSEMRMLANSSTTAEKPG
ncbi:hypothetical protein, partial [Rhizobium johnstonii]|uniref:hypothetical protein n=1 Tax=Rhizobium johnstonii TaxID=3019933 RepID=UPI003F9AD522